LQLFSAAKKDLSNCSDDYEGPKDRDMKNYDTGAFNIKAIIDSKPADSESISHNSPDRYEPLSSCCCDVEDEE
jgi:hypothetical protein